MADRRPLLPPLPPQLPPKVPLAQAGGAGPQMVPQTEPMGTQSTNSDTLVPPVQPGPVPSLNWSHSKTEFAGK